jgi:acyl-coenzyme A thioesterase PaaI-like protein
VHAAVRASLIEIEPGRCTATLPVPPADGLDAGLWLLADFASGLAVTGTLAAGERITTLRLTLHVVARDLAAGTLHATGCLRDHLGASALSTADIVDDDGRVVARATGRNAVLADEVAASYTRSEHPWGAPPVGAADLIHLDADGAWRPDPRAVNTANVVQGGVLASAAVRALVADLGGPPDEATATFLRPVPVEGAALWARTEVEHGGRTLRSARVTLLDARDRTVLLATGLRYAGS